MEFLSYIPFFIFSIPMASNLNALLIGSTYHLLWALPRLLNKAGFSVDVITSDPLMKYCHFVRNCECVSLQSLIFVAMQRIKKYDWIVVAEDGLLQEVVRSSFSLEDKLKILPVLREENLSHLYSKIGLSQTLAAHNVKTPLFSTAHNVEEALLKAEQLGYPILIKRDSSAGGQGVFECNKASDFQLVPRDVFDLPVLVQKKISGRELDVSAIYFKGELVHFNYAIPEKICGNRFGVSSLRTYYPLSVVEESLFIELAQIGKALGAHGFTNIACIQQVDGQRFYFEADMRPNAWVDTPYFLKENISLRIQEWFSQKKTLSYPVPILSHQPLQMRIPYFLRLSRWELLVNRYGVWKFIPWENGRFVVLLILHKMFVIGVKDRIVPFIKWFVPQKYHPWLRSLKRGCVERFQKFW